MEKIIIILAIILACISHTFCETGNKPIEQGNEEGLPKHPIEVSKSSVIKTDNRNVIQPESKQNITGSESKPVKKPLNVAAVRRVSLLRMKKETLVKSKNIIAKSSHHNTTHIKPVGPHGNKPKAKWELTMTKEQKKIVKPSFTRQLVASNLTIPIKRIPIVVSNKTAVLPVPKNTTVKPPGYERNKILPIPVTFNRTLAAPKNKQEIPPYAIKLTAFNKTINLISNKTSTKITPRPSGVIQNKTLVLDKKRNPFANGSKPIQNNVSCTRVKPPIESFIQTRIVHGTDARPAKYPFIVSISDAITSEHRCGGSIIHWYHVLTAAHCCVNPGVGSKYSVINYRTMRLQAGDIELKSSKWSNTRIYRYPNKIIPHPKYDPKTVENDICIIRFPRMITASQYVNVIALAESTAKVGQQCEIAGWGRIKEKESAKPVTLRKAKLKIISQKECNGPKAYRGIVPPNTVCASWPLNAKESVDACQGDSGGPLICNNELVGVVSWGRGCGRTKYPGIYTDVSQFSDWIQSVIEHEGESDGCSIVKLQLHVKLLMVMVITIKCCILIFV